MPNFPRRRFLQQALGGVTSLAAMGAMAPTRSTRQLGVALVGLGYYSTDLLAPALQLTQHCYLAGVVSGSPEKLSKWQKAYRLPDRNCYSYATFDDIANNPAIDVVYVVLPNALHRSYVERAAAAGKHVWCEKPLALNADEAAAMVAACRANRVQLSVGYRMQHEPNTREIMRLGREKPTGPIQLVRAAAGFNDTRQIEHWRQKKALGGGAMYDMGIYCLNAARYATQEEPVAVTAQAFVQRPEWYAEVDETMLFTLEFPSGALATGVTSFGMSLNQLQVVTAGGSYELSPFQAYSKVQGFSSWGQQWPPAVGNQQARQMDQDALAILQGQSPTVPGEEGWRDCQVLDAIFKAATTGQRVKI